MLEIFKAEFDGAVAEGGLFLLTMHPHIIGHRSRIALLAELIRAHEERGRRLVRHPRGGRALLQGERPMSGTGHEGPSVIEQLAAYVAAESFDKLPDADGARRPPGHPRHAGRDARRRRWR